MPAIVSYGLDVEAILTRFDRVRIQTEALCAPLQTEDYVIQAMGDVSPAKWHLAHVTWFFENFILVANKPGYKWFHHKYPFLFNSYYESFGEFWSRPQRGTLARPTVQEIYDYRHHVTEQVRKFISEINEPQKLQEVLAIVELGLHHEQQHQELILSDIKYNFSINPLKPVYLEIEPAPISAALKIESVGFSGGLVEAGATQRSFSYDNERPRHKVHLEDYQLQNRMITCGEFLSFIEDGGYEDFRHWLYDGWRLVQVAKWRAPLYWEKVDGQWYIFTLGGMKELNKAEPVSHISFYEAEAYARWAGKRLPNEVEWENAAANTEVAGNFQEDGIYHPQVANAGEGLRQMYGDLWEWTTSHYAPYPGFKPLTGELGEYNGKFMGAHRVLRGGAHATPQSHVRATYRNFFNPDKRWCFAGFRLAE